MNNQPLVSVPVITYNSSKFVLETLESIKAQTYQNIELIISDDCSTDNTVDLCRKWAEENKERFVRTQIITSGTNTGVSANLNRAEAACQGEWVKGIAGDDLLMPDCVENCVNYITQFPDKYVLFGRYEVFGLDKLECDKINANIDYSFFKQNVKEQLYCIVFKSNCVPAISCFYNRQKIIELGILNDERIPFLEDWPKWINILEKGVKLELIDKIIVKYRVGKGLSTTKRFSLKYYESLRLMHYYYLYPRWCKQDVSNAIIQSVKEELEVYKQLLELENKGEIGIILERDELLRYNQYIIDQLRQRECSLSYRLGYFLLHPLKVIMLILKKYIKCYCL